MGSDSGVYSWLNVLTVTDAAYTLGHPAFSVCGWLTFFFSQVKSSNLNILASYFRAWAALILVSLQKPDYQHICPTESRRIWEDLSDGWFLMCNQRGLLSAWACVQRRGCLCSLSAFPRCRKHSCLFFQDVLVLVYAAFRNWKTLLCKGLKEKIHRWSGNIAILSLWMPPRLSHAVHTWKEHVSLLMWCAMS